MDAEGKLSEETIALAQELGTPHARVVAVEDEQNTEVEEGTTPPLFMFSQRPLCECSKCASLLSGKKRARTEERLQRPHRAKIGRMVQAPSLTIPHPMEQ